MLSDFRNRLYLSTTASDANALAKRFDLGIELAEFCTAQNLDENFPQAEKQVCASMKGVRRFTFHAPYSELCPAAIDPKILAVTRSRYDQAIRQACLYGAHKVIIHSGYIPFVYFPAWFVPRSISFWKEYLETLPEGMTICLENVLEPSPDMLCEIAAGVNDPRFRLCLDVGHANDELSRTPVMDWIDAMAPWLGHVHLHNNDGITDLHDPLGKGVLDMDSCLVRLEEACPTVTYAIENHPEAAESVGWLCQHGYL